MGARVRMFLAWAAFAAWVAWLAWQSARHGRFPVVSRAQLLNADLVVVAELSAGADGRPSPTARVTEVVSPAGIQADFGPGGLTVADLPECSGFAGTGKYLLILKAAGPGSYRIAGVPRSPGLNPPSGPPVLYSATPDVLGQIQSALR